MSKLHIYIDENTAELLTEYADNNNCNPSEALRRIVNSRYASSEEMKQLKENNILLERMFSKLMYIRDLLEQFYSDMEIDKLSNPKNSKSLQKFKISKDKTKYVE